jgi:glycerol-3-phosphate cytidylyltransferase
VATRIGYASGIFDRFHMGHLNHLKQARGQCDFLVAGIASDPAVAAVNGKPPVISAAARLRIVWGVEHVDYVIVDNTPSKLEVWERIRFEVMFKGDDWRGTEKGLLLEAELATVGAEVVYLPYANASTTTRPVEVLASASL